MSYNMLPDSTKIENVPPKLFRGFLVIALGGVFIFPLSIFGFFMFILPGIALFVFGIMFIMAGLQLVSNRIRLNCPYCEKTWIVSKRMTASKCPSCKKTGVIKDGFMTPID